MHNRLKPYRSFLYFTATFFLLLSFIIVACNSSPNAVPTPTPSPNPTSPVNVQPCGVVATFGTVESVPTQAISISSQTGKCFWQAVQQCRPSSLIYINPMGVVRVFIVQKPASGSACIISDTVQQGQGSSQTKQVYPCSHVEAVYGGEAALRFVGCGKDGAITIPINTMLQ